MSARKNKYSATLGLYMRDNGYLLISTWKERHKLVLVEWKPIFHPSLPPPSQKAETLFYLPVNCCLLFSSSSFCYITCFLFECAFIQFSCLSQSSRADLTPPTKFFCWFTYHVCTSFFVSYNHEKQAYCTLGWS